LAMSDAGTLALVEVALTWVVGNAVPFHFTTEVETKLVPVKVKVNPALPAMAAAGDSVVTVGSGLSIVNVI